MGRICRKEILPGTGAVYHSRAFANKQQAFIRNSVNGPCTVSRVSIMDYIRFIQNLDPGSRGGHAPQYYGAGEFMCGAFFYASMYWVGHVLYRRAEPRLVQLHGHLAAWLEGQELLPASAVPPSLRRSKPKAVDTATPPGRRIWQEEASSCAR